MKHSLFILLEYFYSIWAIHFHFGFIWLHQNHIVSKWKLCLSNISNIAFINKKNAYSICTHINQSCKINVRDSDRFLFEDESLSFKRRFHFWLNSHELFAQIINFLFFYYPILANDISDCCACTFGLGQRWWGWRETQKRNESYDQVRD